MEEKKYVCSMCGELMSNDEVYVYGKDHFCEDCYKNRFLKCSCCGDIIDKENDDYKHVGNDLLCSNCVKENTITCGYCGKIVYVEESCTTRDYGDVCEYCRDAEFVECEDCGALIHCNDIYYYETEDAYYCNDCIRDHDIINEYHTKREILFYGDTENNSKPYMGFELEVERTARFTKDSMAHRINDIMNEDYNFINFEYDGSLNDGFENITQPATLDYHLGIKDKYEEMLKELVSNGFLSHNTTTCGLHVHINKNFFGETENEQDICIIRLLYLVEKYWKELLKFSRRNLKEINKWATKYNLKDMKDAENVVKHKKAYDRYFAVNLKNKNTVELRLFRGTLKLNTLIATLQLVNNLATISKETKDINKFRQITWEQIINTEELKQYWEEVKNRNVE